MMSVDLMASVSAWYEERYADRATFKPGDRVTLKSPAKTFQDERFVGHSGRHGTVVWRGPDFKGRAPWRYGVRLDGDGERLNAVPPCHLTSSAHSEADAGQERRKQGELKARLLAKFGLPPGSKDRNLSTERLAALKNNLLGRRARIVDAAGLSPDRLHAEGVVSWWNTWGGDRLLVDVTLDSGIKVSNLRNKAVQFL